MEIAAPDRGSGALSLAPFAAAVTMAWIAVIVGSSIDWRQYALATALLLLAGAVRVTGLLRRRWGETPSALIFLAAVGLLRGSAGGIASNASVLSLIPVFYTALYSDGRRQLCIVLAGMAALYVAPILLIGAPEYPNTQYRAALLTVAISSIIGLTTQRLVAAVRDQAGEAHSRGRMLEEVSQVLRDLFSSSDARVDVCEAAKRIGGARAVTLYEPQPGSEVMRSTVIVGMEAQPIEIPADRPNAVHDAFRSGAARLITENIPDHVGSMKLWQAAGCPGSILYEPLLRGAEAIGVLTVAWPEVIQVDSARVRVVEMLAHEAAAVFTRADAMDELSDMATTDSLTGLPNRRAWDEGVQQALSSGREFTIAMLDFDYFKQYNDAYGHLAGDRMLKETAAAWRDQLRAGDLLARLGGEEFGLLLLDCHSALAIEVIGRLRRSVYDNRTCSVGFAARRPMETVEEVMARADAALYEAKTSGRDRACMSS